MVERRDKEYYEYKSKRNTKRCFSLDNDTADHAEIKNRLEDGGQITGTNMCADACYIYSFDWIEYEFYSSNYRCHAYFSFNGKYSGSSIWNSDCQHENVS